MPKGIKRPLTGTLDSFFVRTVSSSEAEPRVVSDCDSPAPSPKRVKHRQSGFNPDWCKDFPWVEEWETGMRCKVCTRHSKRPKRSTVGQAVWLDKPCTWLVKDAITRHQKSDSHQEAMALEASRTLRQMQTQINTVNSINKQAWMAAFKTLYWLAKREIPHTTNYKPLLELCKDLGVDILNNLNRAQNDKSESERFVQDVMLTLGSVVQAPILEDIRQSPFYSIMLDETTDIQVVKEMIVYARYLKDGSSHTEFLQCIPLVDGKADTIVTALLNYLHSKEIPIRGMCGLGSDGAAVMLGKQNGVAKKLKEEVPHLISNHCVAHRLALAVSQSAKDIPYLKTFKDILDQLHRFYKYSPVRTAALHQLQALYDEKTLKLTQAKDVRWLSHDLATSTLKKCLPAVISSLEREAQERNDAQAMGLSVFVQNYKFLAALMMMCDILPHMSALSKAMQARDAIYTTIRPLVNGTLAIIRQQQRNPGENFQQLTNTIASLQQQNFNIRDPSQKEIDNFKSNVFDKFLTNLETNVEGRFPDLPLIENYAVFDTTNLPDVECERQSHGTEEITNLAVHFSLNQQTTLTEWSQVKETAFHKQPMNADRTMEWIARDLAESHPNVQKLAVAGLLIPTSTADCERGFSTLKRVKTTHRSVMSNRVLNSLLSISMQGPPVSEVDFAEAVNTWHKQGPRRTSL